MTESRTGLVELFEPHSDKQSIIIRCTQIPELTELWVSCGTKFGKTVAGVASYCSLAPRLNDGIIRHVAPIYSQAKIGMRYAQKFLPPKPYTKINNSLHNITFPGTNKNQVIEYWHGKDPESLEGEGVMFYLLDEASKMKRSVYDSALTTMTMTRGLLAATSTPRGKNSWFYNKCVDAKAEMDWCLAKGRNPTKIFLTATTADNPYVMQETLKEKKRNLPDRLWRQYYLAEFIDSGEIFPYFRDAIVGDPILFEMDSQLWLKDGNKKVAGVIIGVDWGKQEDYAVFTAWCPKLKEMIGFMRFRGIDYVSAIKNLIWFGRQFESLLLVRHDKTGLGEVIDDALASTDLPYEGVVFTNKSKSEMVNGLMLAFQRHDIEIPNWPDMVKELDSYEVIVSDIGNWKYAAGDGHDDIVSSMFLGWAGVEEYAPTSLEVISLDQLDKMDLEKPNFEPSGGDFYEWMGKI